MLRSSRRSAQILAPLIASLSLLGACAAAPPRSPEVQGMPRDDRSAPFSAVWIGHATVLMRFGTHTVLADPNLANQLFFLSRLTAPSMHTGDLPPIDAVILSHMHFDHFDARTVRALGPRPAVLYPKAGAAYSDEILQPDQRPMDVWETTEVDGLRITAVPARHQGGRYGFDFLWNHAFTGYIIEGAGKRIYFAGDTGWDPKIFTEIGKRFPGIDLAFIPIAPAWSDSTEVRDRWGHVGPRLALKILAATGAKAMVPIHYESFFSTSAHYSDARRGMEKAAQADPLGGRVLMLHQGERIVLPLEGGPQVIGKVVAPAQADNAAAEPAAN